MLEMIIDLKEACHCTLVNHLHQRYFDSGTAAELSNYYLYMYTNPGILTLTPEIIYFNVS